MKLKIITVDVPAFSDRKGLLLADESGEWLPNQADVAYEQPLDGAARVTVTFIVDGERVALG